MAVPAPSIAPALIAGSTNHAVYNGACGVNGVAQNLYIDLTCFGENIRNDPHFSDQLYITVKATSAGITDVTPVNPASTTTVDAENEYATVQVSSDDADNEFFVIVEHRHTVGR